MNESPASHPSASAPVVALTEVRFSLPDLLRDVQEERNTSALASDKIDQLEIVKLFQKNRVRRANRPRK
jgi:hypothetical protein